MIVDVTPVIVTSQRNVEGADNAEEGRKKGGDSVLLHLDLNPMNVLITRWSVPRLAHPRATRPQVHYFGAKVRAPLRPSADYI